MSNQIKRAGYWAVVAVSVLLIWGGYQLTKDSAALFRGDQTFPGIPCRVEEITYDHTTPSLLGGNYYMERILIFHATLLSGAQKGEGITVFQSIDTVTTTGVLPIEKGDKIFAHKLDSSQHQADWVAGEYCRSDYLLLLGAVFFAGLILFGRKKGISTILSLSFTCLSIFLVFVPAILSGYNPYLVSALTCVYIIGMTLTLVCGFSAKTLAAAVGCGGGVAVAGLLSLWAGQVMKLTGYLDDNYMYVSLLNEDHPLDLRGIIFAAIVIGALGATMDVSMDIASSLFEIKEQVPGIGFVQLVQSGLSIGRDIMGTMANTLILAYIGSSLATVLLFLSYQGSLIQLFNREIIVVELLQTLAGSIGILCTIPISALTAAWLYVGQRRTQSVQSAPGTGAVQITSQDR